MINAFNRGLWSLLITRLAPAAYAAAAIASATLPAAGEAAYPVDRVTMVVPYGAGGAGDIVGRIVADELGKRLGVTFVVENVPGGGGLIGAERVARAAADGGTLLLAGNAIITTAPHVSPAGFDPLSDLVAIANVSEAVRMMVASKTLPIDTLEDFIAYAKANPGALNYGTAGIGSTGHITTLGIVNALGIEATHVPYGGSAQAIQAVLSGDVQFIIDATAIPQVRQDAVTALAVPADTRLEDFPDVPALGELGYAGIRGAGLQLVMGPAGMPQAVVEAIETALLEAGQSAEFTAILTRAGVAPRPMSSAELTAHLADEHAYVGDLVATLNLKN
ncbi:MAG: Bug family tripartite tricarboxylate transporter substrate binding protein [Devosia sp.]